MDQAILVLQYHLQGLAFSQQATHRSHALCQAVAPSFLTAEQDKQKAGVLHPPDSTV